MTARGRGRGVGAALAAGLVTAAAVAACAGRTAGSRAEATAGAPAAPASPHPEVDTGIATCAQCHQQATPEVVTQWAGSRHGLALVECLVCHGSTGSDFKPRPGTAGCQACHAVQAASVTRDGKAASCFACHGPHALRADGKTSPHPRQAQEGS